MLPPMTTSPYPPYDGGVAAAVGNVFRDDEIVASDIPWAVAWYGGRTAVWTPFDRDDFLAINDNIRGGIAGVYLTQATPQSQTVTETWAGNQRFWTRMYQPPQLWNPPDAQFPLQTWRPMTPDGMQVLLSTRTR